MSAGTKNISASGYIDGTNITKVYAMIIISGGAGGVVSLKNANTTTLTTQTGTTGTGAVFTFNTGLLFPGGCYVNMDVNTVSVTLVYSREPSSSSIMTEYNVFPFLAASGSSPIPYSFADDSLQGLYRDSSLGLVLDSDGSNFNLFTGGQGMYSGEGEDLILGAGGASSGYSLNLSQNGQHNIIGNANPFEIVDSAFSNSGLQFATDGSTWTIQGNSTNIQLDAQLAGTINMHIYNTDAATFDASAVAGNTRLLLWDVTAGALVRVSRGASDSGGTGFRLLRVPN